MKGINVFTAYPVARSIWRHLRAVDGYQPFGYDWITLKLTRPHVYRVLRECYRILGQGTEAVR